MIDDTPLFVIRGEINGKMCYVHRPKGNGEYVAEASSVGINNATLFEFKPDAVNALGTMRHGVAVLMEIVELTPAV